MSISFRAGIQDHLSRFRAARCLAERILALKPQSHLAIAFLALWTFSTAAGAGTLPFDNPPVRCAGYGNLNSIVLKNWETGLGTWTVGTHDIANPSTFDTPDWAVVGGLPGGRDGSAAFVANIDEGDCGADDETGALTLTSPSITIPAGAQVPRISIQHWFDIEHGWDGGNLRISVNGGPFNLIPPSAIQYGSYNDTLEPAMMFGDVWNTNPLAGQLAYTSPEDGQPPPTWGTTHVNLLGIAQPGNSIRLRFDFGIDGCNGNVGWYVDDVEFYYCQAELPPSNCGNGVINGGEQCDDGNNFINDGCSNTCQIESGWECTAPTAPGTIPDHSFEDGTPNDFWDEVSNNPIGTPICRESVCTTGGGTGPSHGTYWAWFGGVTGGATDGSLTQSFVIPAQVSRLTFDLEAHRCDSEPDYVELLIDGNQEWVFDGSHPLCGQDGYTRRTVDIEAYADGGVHQVQFHGETFAIPGGRSDFFIDNTALPGDPSLCSRIGTSLTLIKNVVNDSGGDGHPTHWTLSASGPSPFSGIGPTVNSGPGFSAGTYNLSESGPSGYSAGNWDCDGGNQTDGDTVIVGSGQSVRCTITNDDQFPTIKVVKTIINNSGGTVTNPNAFGLMVDGDPVQHNVANQFVPGQHTVSEAGLAGYAAGAWGGDCNPDGTIHLVFGQNAVCTITNDDISPTLRLQKTIINDNGGTVTNPNAFGLRIDDNSVQHNVFNPVNAGAHTVSEVGLSGYQPSAWGGDCTTGGNITLALGQNATCTITNNDIAPTLTVVKTIVNNNGGTVTDPNAFGLKINGNPVMHNVANTLNAGSHTVSETGLSGYIASPWGGNCNPNGTITLSPGQNATCSITNDDTNTTSLTLVKQVVNDNGGTAAPSAWTLTATGPTGFSGPGPSVSNGPNFSAGTYDLSESGGPGGYSASAWVCVGGTQNDGDTITLALGQSATCTITNNDITPTLRVVKTIVNNNGGTVTNPNAFGLKVDGNSVQHNIPTPFNAGPHVVSETGLPGYIAGPWGGNCNANGSITLVPGQNAVCTITNDDSDQTSLTLVKQVINDNGGSAAPSAWTLIATGPSSFSGSGPMVSSGPGFFAGTYDLSETGGPSGYAAGNWVCVGGTQNDGDTVTLAPGQSATCTITNNDISPTITVVKTIVNNNGGTQNDPNAFGLRVDGNSVQHNVTNPFHAGPHTVSEVGLPGYAPGPWGGDCNANGSITLALDQDAVCTITNDDTLPTITVVKTIVNNNGGTVTDPNAFGLKVDGNAVQHNTPTPFSVGMHTASETGLPGYAQSAWGGACNANGTINLAFGQNAVCTITNDDISPTLTVVKTIVNNNGGTVTDPNNFGLKVDGNPVMHNVTNPFNAGPHTVSETGLPGYVPGPWGGNCNPDGTITLALAQNATCTITNDDTDTTSLSLNKQVINDNGGATAPSAWTLTAAGPTGFSGPGPSVSSGAGFSAGTYNLFESGPAGYAASSWVCVGGTQDDGDTITIDLGESASCTITNNDISPTLTVVKTIVNDNGGTVTDPNAFGLKVDGNAVLHNASNPFNVGFHTVSETGLPGYIPGPWGGDCNPDGTINLALDQDATCTITNDDSDETSLTLMKVVVNDNGGTSPASAWTLTATGPTGFSGSGPSVSSGAGFDAGTYDLSENGPAGYQASDWVCSGGSQVDGDTITVELGQSATCTINNNDISPTLTVVKSIVNDNGGIENDPNAFGLKVDGNSVLHNVANEFDAGPHTVSETGLPGYNAGPWGGDCSSNGTITLVPGEDATCTITNDDVATGEIIFNHGFESD